MSEGGRTGARRNTGEIQAYKGETGDISITYNELGTEVNWRISHFWSLLEEDGVYYKSPNFSFDRHRWWLVIYPNGDGECTSVGYIDLRLVRYSDNLPESYDVLMSLESTNGSKVNKKCNTKVFEKDSRYQHFNHFISRFELRKRLAELLPQSILTVSCTLKKETPPKGSRMCSYCKKRFDPESISSHQKKCTQKPIKCPDCLEVIHLQKWLDDHECQMERAAALEKLSNDLKEMLVNEDHSDVLVIVKGEKFRLHKNILAARNPFFCAMFNNDMREKNTGIVRINDCAPDVFRYFIHFLYTGNADSVSSENVFELHEIANKYHEDQLKKGCLHFMMSMMSVDNFCDLVAFALRYDYKNLLQNATEFFLENAKEIVNSEKWIIFQEEYPRQANEYNLAFNNFDVK